MRHTHLRFGILLAAAALGFGMCARTSHDADRTSPPAHTPTHADREEPPGLRERPEEPGTTEGDAPVAPEPEPTFPLRVRVALPGGAPFESVAVAVHRTSEFQTEPPPSLARATTGPDGTVEFDLPRGDYELRAQHARLRVDGADVQHPGQGDVRLGVGDGPRLIVRVTDPDGAPVAGALVWEEHAASGRVARSDATGAADLGRVFPDQPFVVVRARGFLPYRNYAAGFWDGRAELDYRVRLMRGMPLDVRVLEHDGAPAEGVEVRHGYGAGRTDTDGRIRFDAVSADPHTSVTARAEDGREVRGEVADRQVDGPLELRLPAGRRISGLVVHADTGAPVPGATVFVERADQRFEVEARTGADGRFVLERIPGERDQDVSVVAFAGGLAAAGEDWSEPATPVDDAVTLRVAPTMTITGRVLADDGDPVAAARVRVVHASESRPLGAREPEAVSGADGRFRVDGVPAVDGLVVLVDDDDGAVGWPDDAWDAVAPVPGAACDVGDIVLPLPFDADLTFVDDDGAPVASATLWISWRVVARGTSSVFRSVLDGRMEPVRRIGRARAALSARGPGLLPTEAAVDATTRRVVMNRPCRVTGRVIDAATSKPLAGVMVTLVSLDLLYTLDGNHGVATTGDDGAFEITGVRRGRYRCGVEGRTVRAAEVEVRGARVGVGTVVVD